MPQVWRVFATARAPISSTSENMSVSTIMGLGLRSVESELAVANSKVRIVRRNNAIDDIVVEREDVSRSSMERTYAQKHSYTHEEDQIRYMYQ